jgi:hypothetical protein
MAKLDFAFLAEFAKVESSATPGPLISESV